MKAERGKSFVVLSAHVKAFLLSNLWWERICQKPKRVFLLFSAECGWKLVLAFSGLFLASVNALWIGRRLRQRE